MKDLLGMNDRNVGGLCFKALKIKSRHHEEILSKDLYMDESNTRRLAVEISCFESYRYAQLQNRELKTELLRVSYRI